MEKINTKNKSWKYLNYLFATILILMFAFIIGSKFVYIYETNDDAFLKSIISGAYTGTPDAHAIYILYPLAFLLAKLYALASGINWYGYCIVGLHYGALVLLLGRALELTKLKINKFFTAIFVCSLIVCIDLSKIVNTQYTMTAGVLAATAVFFIVTAKWENPIRESIIPGVLLLLTLNLRKDVFLISIAFVIIVITGKIIRSIREKTMHSIRKEIIKYGFVALVFFILTGSMLFIHKWEYRSDEWGAYLEFNDARTTIYDYNSVPVYAENIAFYEEIGINNEYEMHILQSGNTTLWTNIDNEMMIKIANKSIELKKWNEQFYSVTLDVISKYVTWILEGGSILFAILAVFMMLLGIGLSQKKYWLVGEILFVELVKGGMVCYLIYLGRYIERATYPINLMEFMILFSILISYWKGKQEENSSRSMQSAMQKYMIYVVLTIGMGLISLSIFRENLHENKALINSRYWEPTVTKYLETMPQNIFFIDRMCTGQLRSPVFGEEGKTSTNRYDMGGWRSKSPLEVQSLERHGIVECQETLATNESIYWVQPVDYPSSWIEMFLSDEKTYERAILYDTIEMAGAPEYNVYKIESISN